MRKPDPSFTFRAAQVFVATVEAGAVTRAAHRLGLSPSSVSQQLASLERALGTRLIERSARSFRLTRAGELFLEPAKRLLDDVGAAKALLATARETPPMSLRVASIEDLDALVTTPWLMRMHQRFPNIAFSMTSGASHENLDALGTRAVDLMLAVDNMDAADWVAQHPLLRDPFILVTAPGRDPSDIAQRPDSAPFMRYSTDLQIGRQIEAQLRRSGAVPGPGPAFATNTALFAMVAEAGGWAITTALAFLGTAGASGTLNAHPLHIPRFARRLALHGRVGALGDLPRQMAAEYRNILAARLLPGAAERLGFLGNAFSVLAEEPPQDHETSKI